MKEVTAQELTKSLVGGKPRLKHCEKHGPYHAFAAVTLSGDIYESQCPKCRQIADELNPPRYELPLVEISAEMISSRLIEQYGVREDFATVTLENMPKALRESQPIIDAAKKIASRQIHNVVVLGPNGVGKTTIAVAIMAEALRRALETRQNLSMHYTTESQLLRAMKTTFSRKNGPTEQDIIDRMGRVDILVIDEIGKASGTDYNMLAIEEIIDIRHQSRPTIICGNPTRPDFMEHLTDSSKSKLSKHGTLIEIDDIDHRKEQAKAPTEGAESLFW